MRLGMPCSNQAQASFPGAMFAQPAAQKGTHKTEHPPVQDLIHVRHLHMHAGRSSRQEQLQKEQFETSTCVTCICTRAAAVGKSNYKRSNLNILLEQAAGLAECGLWLSVVQI